MYFSMFSSWNILFCNKNNNNDDYLKNYTCYCPMSEPKQISLITHQCLLMYLFDNDN